ncbi:MAG: hypothetical protein ACR2FU_04735 [Streptosporangiaceae bacterium]
MTAVTAPAAPRQSAARRPGRAAARLLRLELRRNAMLLALPVVIALFWFAVYRKAMAMPPAWNLRAAALQSGAVVTFVCPVAGAAAWMGSREARCRTTDLVGIAARPRWARSLTTWAATTAWALAAYLACVAVLYAETARQTAGGGPLWWPALVGAASLPAMSALGFAAGTLVPSRFTAPLTAVALFFAIALSTQPIHGSQSNWQVSPTVTGPWDIGPDPGIGTFYPYLPDLPIAQVIFLAGLTIAVLAGMILTAGRGWRSLRWPAAALTAAGLVTAATAVALAGTGHLDSHGMIAIPVLHDAASYRPLRYAPVCSRTAIPVCLNPAYAVYLPATAAALAPMLAQIAGLPGAPGRVSQAAVTYRQARAQTVLIGLTCPRAAGRPLAFRLVLPDQLPGPQLTAGQQASVVRSVDGQDIVASVTGDGPLASPAQRAVTTALLVAAGVSPRHLARPPAGARSPDGNPAPLPPLCPLGAGPAQFTRLAAGSSAFHAALQFAALPATARHAWLTRHLAALRAGRISLRQLP